MTMEDLHKEENNTNRYCMPDIDGVDPKIKLYFDAFAVMLKKHNDDYMNTHNGYLEAIDKAIDKKINGQLVTIKNDVQKLSERADPALKAFENSKTVYKFFAFLTKLVGKVGAGLLLAAGVYEAFKSFIDNIFTRHFTL